MEKRCPSLPSEICAQFTDGMEHPIKQMGGTTGPGSSIMMLTNLQNSSHIDFNDTFPSFAVWVELKPGTAHDWFVLLLNMSVDSSSGLAVRLYHGDCLFCTNPGDAFQDHEGTSRASRSRVSTQMATTTAVAVALIVAVTNFKSIVFHFVATIG